MAKILQSSSTKNHPRIQLPIIKLLNSSVLLRQLNPSLDKHEVYVVFLTAAKQIKTPSV